MIVAALDFIKEPDSLSDAVRRSLESFMLAMQAQGRVPKRTDEEVTAISEPERSKDGDRFTGIEDYVEQTSGDIERADQD